MSKVVNALAALWAGLKAYPHGVALALNLGVVLGARFGLHLTPDELVAIAGAASVAATAFTHKAMVSRSQLTGGS